MPGMKALLRALVLVFVATSCFAQDAVRLDQIVQTYVQNKTFMGSVLVARGADVILSKGYGAANLEWDIPNTPSTRFRLGSITKQFTAASILLLEERGKLQLEDPIKTYLADAPAAWDRITIFNLLTHSSGIPNFTSLSDYKTLQLADTPLVKTIAMVRDKPLDFFPGEKMSYSNSGSVNAGYIHMSVPHAAGALYSTTEDLLRWEQGLFGGKVVSSASLQKMMTPFKNDYAFGLVVQTIDGRKVVQHGGGIEGFNTFLAYYPDDRLTVVVLANINGPAPNAIAAKLATVARGGTVQTSAERKEIALPKPTLEKYVGTYEVAPGVNMWVRLQEDHLTTQLAGQPELPIFPESETKFFLKAVDAQIEFVNDVSGEVTRAVLRQNGRDLNAARTSTTIAGAPQHHEITVPVSTLSKYIGTYRLRPNVDLSITLDSNQLMAQMTGQPKFPIFAESATLFFYKVVDATLEFQTDASGTATGVRLRQGPVDDMLPRR